LVRKRRFSAISERVLKKAEIWPQDGLWGELRIEGEMSMWRRMKEGRVFSIEMCGSWDGSGSEAGIVKRGGGNWK